MHTVDEYIIITFNSYNNRGEYIYKWKKRPFIHPCMMLLLKRYTLDESSPKIDITASTDRATVVNIRFDT